MASWPTHTTTALKRWSCQEKELPPVEGIKSIHVYDFDNTLFASPLPNKALWAGPTVGQLQGTDIFVNGGWWHDANILAATGEGIEKEEPRAWAGWWNELIVELVQFSMQQKDAIAVLLTGRSEEKFSELVQRILRSRHLEFDMMCLKPAVGPSNQQFSSTMNFKQALLQDLVYTYKDADDIRVYEDRQHHVKQFRDYFNDFNTALLHPNPPVKRKCITAEVIQVSENATSLNPVVEVSEVQRMINSHNLAIKNGLTSSKVPRHISKSVLFTGYMIPGHASEKLKQLVHIPPQVPASDIRYLADNVLISPRPLSRATLEKIGGLGKKLTWRVTGTAVFENKVWAARVEPVPPTEKYHCENSTPSVVVALLRAARPADASRIQNWQPVAPNQAIEFETTVGEKAILRVDEERSGENQYPKYGRTHPTKHPREDDNAPAPAPQQPRSNGNNRNGGGASNAGNPTNPNHRGGANASHRGRGNHPRGPSARGRGGAGSGGGYGRGSGSGRGRGRGGFGQYRSLDDMADGGYPRASGYRDYDRSNATGGTGYDGAQDEGLYDAY